MVRKELAENMKLSVESKVAAAVAAGFIALTAAAIVQGGDAFQSGGPRNDDLINKPEVNLQVRKQAYNSFVPGRSDVEENRQKFSDQDVTGATSKRNTKGHASKI